MSESDHLRQTEMFPALAACPLRLQLLPNPAHALALLRARRKRPGDSRAAKQRDELAAARRKLLSDLPSAEGAARE
jgi:hypothetical protein